MPAQSYSAALSISASDAIDGIKSAAVLEHLSLSNQQHQKVDATFGPELNVTFMYRKAPLLDAVLPSSVPQCKDSFITMRQGANVTSYITLRETYGNGRVCAHVNRCTPIVNEACMCMCILLWRHMFAVAFWFKVT